MCRVRAIHVHIAILIPREKVSNLIEEGVNHAAQVSAHERRYGIKELDYVLGGLPRSGGTTVLMW